MQPDSASACGTVSLGRISGAYGVRGWLRIFSDTEPRDAILDYRPWLIGDAETPMNPVQGRMQGRSVVARLEGISDRETAEGLSGQQIRVRRDQLPELPDEEYYWADLIGLAVFNRDGLALGSIAQMIATGANDVMIVRGDRERLIPFVPGLYVTGVDLEKRRVTVDWDPDF